MDSIKKGKLRFEDNPMSGCYDKVKPQDRNMQGDNATFSQARIRRELEGLA